MTQKILVITDNLLDQINGVVTTFTNIKVQAENNGYNLEFITPENFRHIDCPGYSEVKLSLPFGLGKLIREIQPDYIHIATEGPIGLFARMWLDMNGMRYNTSYHTKFPEFLNKLYRIPEFMTYAYLRWFHKHSGKVLVTTNSMKKELCEKGFQQDLIVWTRGVDRSVFCPRLEMPSSHIKKLVNIGRISKEKGLDDFCSLDIPNTMKILVGDGPYKNQLMKRYPDVVFVSSKRGSELAKYFADADVFVFPSKADTFGIVMIESLVSGTPVAAYPVTGPIDVIENDVNGYISEDLKFAVERCLDIDRKIVYNSSNRWTWENCWKIFKENLVSVI
jgi:glycosyltransferase involved in cell wall biosynthesis